MFRVDRLLRFVGHVLWELIPSFIVVLVLSFVTQLLAWGRGLPGVGRWTQELLGVIGWLEDLPAMLTWWKEPSRAVAWLRDLPAVATWWQDLPKVMVSWGELLNVLMSWQFWLGVVLGFAPLLLAFSGAFLLAARFLNAVYPKLRWKEAVRFLIHSRFDRPFFGPFIKIQGGEIVGSGESSVVARIGGPGALIVAGDNAVVLQRGAILTSVQGPSFPQLRPFEKVHDIIDLGPKTYRHTVQAMSREGIRLDWDVEVQYQVADGGQPVLNGALYPVSPDDIFLASTSKCIREKDWKYGQDMDWEGLLVVLRADGTLRTIVARRPLDHLIGLAEGEEQAAKNAILTELEKDLRAYAPTVGAKILQVRLDNLKVRDEVAKEWIAAWKARWQAWAAEQLGHGEATYVYEFEKVKAKAQAEMVLNIAQALRDFRGSQPLSQQAISQMVLMRLFSVLDRADFAASSRVFFPAQTLDALETIRRPVKGSPQLRVSALIATPSTLRVSESTTIQATIRDKWGNPAPDGTQVAFGSDAGTLSAQMAQTISSVAQTTLTAATAVGKAQVRAQASADHSKSITVKFLPGPPATVSLRAVPASIEPDGEADLLAEALDTFGNPVADGTEAHFRTTRGRLSVDRVQTQQGRAQIRLAANGSVGQADVSVQVGQQSTSEQVLFVGGAPHRLDLAADSPEVEVSRQVRIRLRVMDSWGNPVVDGTAVTFQSSSGSVLPGTNNTSSGQASADFAAGPHPGLVTVTALVAQKTKSVDLVIVPGAPRTVQLLTGSRVRCNSSMALSVVVKDAEGNAVADGTPVVPTTDLGTIDPLVGTTSKGVASFEFNAGSEPGKACLTAKAGSIEAFQFVTIR